MLRKLMKHEWIAVKKQTIILFLVYIACLATSGFLSLLVRPSTTMELAAVFTLFSFLISYAGIIIFTVGAQVIVAHRYYTSCYSDEGYLTHTLPVTTHMLNGSKLLFHSEYTLITALISVVLFVPFLLLSTGQLFSTDASVDYYAELGMFVEACIELLKNPSVIAILALIILLAIISYVFNTLLIFCSISLGQLYTKHRIIGGIIAYFIIHMIVQFVVFIYTFLLMACLVQQPLSETTLIMLFLGLLSVPMILMSVGLYWLNHNRMSKHLNLE